MSRATAARDEQGNCRTRQIHNQATTAPANDGKGKINTSPVTNKAAAMC